MEQKSFTEKLESQVASLDNDKARLVEKTAQLETEVRTAKNNDELMAGLDETILLP